MQTLFRSLSFPIALLAALPLLLALLLFAAGCDSNGGPDNQAPTINGISFTPQNPGAGAPVSFDADVSDDRDGPGALAYSWDFDGDGQEDASTPTPSHTFDVQGNYDIALTVTDSDGASTSSDDSGSNAIVNVGAAPVPSANYDTTGTIISIDEQDGEGIVVVDDNGDVIDEGDGDDASVTWSSDYTYVLNGRIYVNDGQTLNIEAGTTIMGDTDFDDPTDASALIVARGGTINATGTADAPIIFTSEGDDSPRDGTFDFRDRGNWGGVLILGHAPNNLGSSGSGSAAILVEGITAGHPRAIYGCGSGTFECDAEDDSGTFQYVSIRYGGATIAPDNEINGLTLGSVGRGTTVDHVEVVSNADDNVEWFGGTVNATHLVSTFVNDDSFDIDQGYTGHLQYLLAVQGYGGGDHGGEHDGGDSDFGGENSAPVANPQICNATYVGAPSGTISMLLREGFAGDYYNSIFTNFSNSFIEIDDVAGNDTDDSRARFENGDINIAGNLLFGFPSGSSFADLVQLTTDKDGNIVDASFRATLAGYLSDNNTLLADGLDGFSIDVSDNGDVASVDAFPAPGSAAAAAAAGNSSECLESTDYKGAFEPGGENWAAGWTALSQSGILADR